MPDLELLWTDAVFFLLLAVGAALAVYTIARPHRRAPWRRLARSRRGMISLIVLSVYLLIAALDSIHMRPDEGGALISALDIVLTPLRESGERSYSAPLALYEHTREFITGADGEVTYDYRRLRHSGADLADDSDRLMHVATLAALGLCGGLACWLLGVTLLLMVMTRAGRRPWTVIVSNICRARTSVPWRSMLVTVAVVCGVIGVLTALSHHYHPLGTDKVGADVLYQSLKSVRTGLLIGCLTTVFVLPLSILFGVAAGYFRGWIDDVVQFVYTTLIAMPGVLLIAAAMLVAQVFMETHASQFAGLEYRADLRLLLLCLILGVTSWTGLCRLLRGEVLKLRVIEFVRASEALGASRTAILVHHVLPNVTHIMLISVALDFSSLVLAEAVLSYVNIGVDPTMSSWGNMINGARLELARVPVVWWSLASAFVFMLGLVLPANFFADALSDAFDPRLGISGKTL